MSVKEKAQLYIKMINAQIDNTTDPAKIRQLISRKRYFIKAANA
jgi:hypothetical protein